MLKVPLNDHHVIDIQQSFDKAPSLLLHSKSFQRQFHFFFSSFECRVENKDFFLQIHLLHLIESIFQCN